MWRWFVPLITIGITPCDSPDDQAAKVVEMSRTTCITGISADDFDKFEAPLTPEQIEAIYNCRRKKIAEGYDSVPATENFRGVAVGVATLDLDQLQMAYDEASYRLVAQGTVTPSDARLRRAAFQTFLLIQIRERYQSNVRQSWNRTPIIAAIKGAPTLDYGASTPVCREEGRLIYCEIP